MRKTEKCREEDIKERENEEWSNREMKREDEYEGEYEYEGV